MVHKVELDSGDLRHQLVSARYVPKEKKLIVARGLDEKNHFSASYAALLKHKYPELSYQECFDKSREVYRRMNASDAQFWMQHLRRVIVIGRNQ